MPAPESSVNHGPAATRAGAILAIDLAAIQSNYRRLREELGGVPCAAVVKANAYGLGLARVAPALAAAGATTFFVAQIEEGIALRERLPGAAIFVLNGLGAGTSDDMRAYDLCPVLNALDEVERWNAAARQAGRPLPAAIHIDTGMNRLGLPRQELARLSDEPARLSGIDTRYVMSHLACAEEPDHPLNQAQLDAFNRRRARLPAAPASFANSSGIFLGATYHFDLARPGVALYGVNPTPGRPSPMRQVVRLQARILQVREIDASQTVGYGATRRVGAGARVATLAAGYADGYLRSLSDNGSAWIGAQRLPVLGRVSMDLITVDASGVAEDLVRPGGFVDLIGPHYDVDALAADAGSIGYEILTALGARYHRIYLDG